MSCAVPPKIAAIECGAAPGGLVSAILIARKSHIASVPEVDADGITISGDIVFKEQSAGQPYKWQRWEFEANFGELMSELEGDRTQSVKHQLDVYVPGGTADVDGALTKAINGKYLVLCQTRDGQYRLAGSLESPMKLTQKFATGKEGKDARGFDLSFTANGLLSHPPFYLGEIEVYA